MLDRRLQPLSQIFGGGLLIGILAACSTAPHPTIVDLTHSFDDKTIYWPTNKHFEWEKMNWEITSKGYWYASGAFAASEHGGTHIDAPLHFARVGSSVDAITVDRLISPAVVIDVRLACQNNPDYILTESDLLTWEAQHGRIEKDTLVLLHTGWERHWPNAQRYLGSLTPDDPTTLHFPGFSAEAMEFLVTHRGIRGVGIDTASIDPGQSSDFHAHQILSRANLYAIENIAGLEQLPTRGATVFALPMKIKGGTGAPVRIIAWVP